MTSSSTVEPNERQRSSWSRYARDCKHSELELHPEKTKIVYCQKGNRKNRTDKCKGFTFLGYDFKPRKQWNKLRRVAFLSFDLGISHKAKIKIRNTIKRVLKCLRPEYGLEQIANLINAKFSGWQAYYGKFNGYLLRGNMGLVQWTHH